MALKSGAPNEQAVTASPIPRWVSACIVAGTFLTLTILSVAGRCDERWNQACAVPAEIWR